MLWRRVKVGGRALSERYEFTTPETLLPPTISRKPSPLMSATATVRKAIPEAIVRDVNVGVGLAPEDWYQNKPGAQAATGSRSPSRSKSADTTCVQSMAVADTLERVNDIVVPPVDRYIATPSDPPGPVSNPPVVRRSVNPSPFTSQLIASLAPATTVEIARSLENKGKIALHEADAAPLYRPVGQSIHSNDPAGQYELTGHTIAVEFTDAADGHTYPALQLLHDDQPDRLYSSRPEFGTVF